MNTQTHVSREFAGIALRLKTMKEETASLRLRVRDSYFQTRLKHADNALNDIDSLLFQGALDNPSAGLGAAATFFQVAESHLKSVRDAAEKYGDGVVAIG